MSVNASILHKKLRYINVHVQCICIQKPTCGWNKSAKHALLVTTQSSIQNVCKLAGSLYYYA